MRMLDKQGENMADKMTPEEMTETPDEREKRLAKNLAGSYDKFRQEHHGENPEISKKVDDLIKKAEEKQRE